jgi:thiol-disulfide isomerase/thioredoxin
VTFRAAPEDRGTSRYLAAAAFAGALFVFAGLAAASGQPASATELRRFSGAAPLTFTLPSTTGAEIALESQRGRVVLVHFFATWCEPCLAELPALNRLAARGGDKIKVLAISVAEVDARVRRFFEATPVDFPVLLDRDRAVTRTWNIATLPTTIVLDAKLNPRLTAQADFDWDSIDADKLTASLVKYPAISPGGSAKTENTTKPLHSGG